MNYLRGQSNSREKDAIVCIMLSISLLWKFFPGCVTFQYNLRCGVTIQSITRLFFSMTHIYFIHVMLLHE